MPRKDIIDGRKPIVSTRQATPRAVAAAVHFVTTHTALSLATIVALSMALAAYWVFLVPIFQSPDENAHLDYALCIFQRGGLFSAREMEFAGSNFYNQHPWTDYLGQKAHTLAIAFHPHAKVPDNYGSAAFYHALDRDAPPLENLEIKNLPSLMRVYPFGYYALLACWIGLLRCFSDSLTVMFFGARMLSVLLLGGNLVLSYLTLKELRLRPGQRLAITACLGCFPLVSFVGSYIQPDNLAFFLAPAAWYLALVARRSAYSMAVVALLGLVLGSLLVCKTHFFLCIAAPIGGMLLVEFLARTECRRNGWVKLILLIGPSLVLGSIHFYTTLGITNYFGPVADHGDTLEFITRGLWKALVDYYGGATHDSFWGVFGWLDAPLIVGSGDSDRVVRLAIQCTGLLLIVLTLVRIEQLTSRLAMLAHRGRWLAALRVALSNPVLNSYFVFTLCMIGLHVWLDNRFGAQGRNWIPFLLPFLLAAVTYAPKALSLPRVRDAFSQAVLAGLLLFVTLGVFYGPRTIRQRYYGPRHGQIVETPQDAELAPAYRNARRAP